MYRLAATFFTALFLAACGTAQYQVISGNDKFSDPSDPSVYYLVGNSIQFAAMFGGYRSDELNAFVMRDKETNKVIRAGFELHRSAPKNQLAFTGEPKWLVIRPGDEMVVLADGDRVVLKAVEGEFNHKVERGFGNSIDTTYTDDATYFATPEQFAKVANAKTIAIKVNGSRGAAVYPKINTPILESFTKNLAKFYKEQIEPYR